MLTSPTVGRPAPPAGPSPATLTGQTGPTGRSAVVVRLEPRAVPPSDAPVPMVDADRLARAVSDLIRAIDPRLSAEVRVEIHPVRSAFDTVPVAAKPWPGRGAVPPAELPPASARSAAGDPDSPPDPEHASVRVVADDPDLILDLIGRTLTVDGHETPLTRREFDLLAHLRAHQGIALGRRELMDAVWQSGYLAGDRTIDVHVRRLRMKLGRQAFRLTTLRGYGYRFD